MIARIALAASLVALVLGYAALAAMPGPARRIPAQRIAPEACEHNGAVRYGLSADHVLAVHCSDGVIHYLESEDR